MIASVTQRTIRSTFEGDATGFEVARVDARFGSIAPAISSEYQSIALRAHIFVSLAHVVSEIVLLFVFDLAILLKSRFFLDAHIWSLPRTKV